MWTVHTAAFPDCRGSALSSAQKHLCLRPDSGPANRLSLRFPLVELEGTWPHPDGLGSWAPACCGWGGGPRSFRPNPQTHLMGCRPLSAFHLPRKEPLGLGESENLGEQV